MGYCNYPKRLHAPDRKGRPLCRCDLTRLHDPPVAKYPKDIDCKVCLRILSKKKEPANEHQGV